MPVILLFLFAFGSGAACAVIAREELRLSPRPPWFSGSFQGYLFFLSLLLLPISVYFYMFHGDWAVMYWFDTQKVPSALALAGFAMQLAWGAGGFFSAVFLIRSHKDSYAYLLLGAAAIGMILSVVVGWSRLAVVGTYDQFHGGFGLSGFGQSAVFQGTLVMGIVLFLGACFLFGSLILRARRVAA